jgi:hypothetical protein
MRDSERLTPRLVKKWTASDQTESMMELRFDKTTRYVIISKRLTKGQRGEIVPATHKCTVCQYYEWMSALSVHTDDSCRFCQRAR